MEPQFSLNYSSQSGSWDMGTGWSLGGVSAITRCPASKATDGVVGGVKLNTGDKFCLDGQRLMVVAGGYGAAGSEYRTEINSFGKITAVGAANGNAAYGPSSFTVLTKSGLTLEYGATVDARIEAQGRLEVAAWALSKMRDIKGNEVTYAYTENNAIGSWRLGAVGYAGRSVQFHYDPRPDVTVGYMAGSKHTRDARLKEIQTAIGGQTVNRTKIFYTADSSASGSRVASVQNCDGADKCLAPLELTWSSLGSASFQSAWVAGPGTHPPPNNVVGDFNGDGRMDMARFTGVGGGWEICYANAAALGFTCAVQNILGAHPVNSEAGDFNGDGKTDLAAYTGVGQSWAVCLSTGTGFSCQGATLHRGNNDTNVNGDFNGDGRVDFASRVPGGAATWDVCLSTSTGSTVGFACTARANVTSLGKSEVGDFDGDGVDDILSFAGAYTPAVKGLWHLKRAVGDGSFLPAVVVVLHGGNQTNNIVADFNGDGLSDTAASLDGNQWEVCLSTGSFANPATAFSCSIWAGHTGRLANNAMGDFNGDGATDIASHTGGGVWNVCLSTGTNFACSSWGGGHGGGAVNNAVGDFNGDGLTDMAAWGGGSNWHFAYSQKVDQAVVQSFKRGADITSVSYQRMGAAGQTVYTKDNSAVYPLKDVAFALRLVSSSTQSNGVGGVNTTTYTYGGLKAEQASGAGKGRGSMGFRWMKVKEEATGIAVTTDFAQVWPHIGQSSKTMTTLQNGSALKQVTNLYGCYQTQGAVPTAGCPVGTGLVYFPFVQSSTEEGWDLNGSNLPKTVTSYAYAGYADEAAVVRQFGDPTTVTSDTSLAGVLQHRKTMTNEYSPAKIAGAQWEIGRLKKASVQSASFMTPAQSIALAGSSTTPPSGSGANTGSLPPPPVSTLPPGQIAVLMVPIIEFLLADE